ncbi:MAG: hypothetical protein IJ955_10660 [Oscillospiraceae bacterium]|nr:hypothetical protein [Oscillospiraceae bacterium]
MKHTNLSTKFMMAAILLTVLIYFGVNLAAYFIDPFSTTVAYPYTNKHSITVSGYVVREEEPITTAGDLVYFSRGEGERVSKGGPVALLYNNQQALSDANTLRSLQDQLDQLTYARSLAAGVQSTISLDGDVTRALTSFHAARASGTPAAAIDTANSVRASVLRYSYAYSGTEELNRSIASLEEKIYALNASISPATTAVVAPESGLFSSLVDGYETILTPELLQDMTPEEYRSIQPLSTSGTGKLVYGSKWYFVTLIRTADSELLRQGDTVTLQFQSGLDRELQMKVERISSEDSGQLLVVLSSRTHLNLVTLLRRQNAHLIFDSFSGIRVPRSAVRIVWETVLDDEGNPVINADGTEKKKQVYGVYCLWGNTARFKPIEILWQEPDYMLVQPIDENNSARCLRSGDEVITAAADLYDGKVIN